MIDNTGSLEPNEKSNHILFFAEQRDVPDLVWRVIGLADGAVFLAGLAMHAVAHREARHVGISTHDFQQLLGGFLAEILLGVGYRNALTVGAETALPVAENPVIWGVNCPFSLGSGCD